jgi:large subunit ribosomal protein L24
MQRIKKDDTVEVIAGKDKGTRGKVLRVVTKNNKVVVEKVNIAKKHQKRQQQQQRDGQQTGGILEFEAPLDASNVMLVCTNCNKRTRVGFRITDEGRKVRVCKHPECGKDID